MTRFALTSLLLLPLLALAADPLPEGAELRLGGPLRFDVHYDTAISPDGTKLATHSNNSAIRVWELVTGKLLYTYERSRAVSQLAWTADGKLIGFGAQYRTEWSDPKDRGPSSERWEEVRKAADPLPTVPSVTLTTFSPNGDRVAMMLGKKDTEQKIVIFPLAGTSINKLLSTETMLSLPVGQPRPGPHELTATLIQPTVSITVIAHDFIGFSDDGNTLFSIQPHPGGQASLYAYNLIADKPQNAVWQLILPPDEKRTVEWEGRRVSLPTKGRPSRVLCADGKRVVIQFEYGQIEVWDGSKVKKMHSWEPPSCSSFGSGERALLTLSPDGKRLAISSRESNGLVGGVVYDLDTGKEVTKLEAGPNATHGALKFSPDGKKLYRRYQVWDAETGKDITPGSGHRGLVRSLLVSGDGKTIVTTGDDLTARGWDAKTGQERWRADFPSSVWLGKLDDDTAVATAAHWSHEAIEKPLVSLSTGKRSPLPGDMATGKKVKWGYGERVVYPSPLVLTPDGKTVVTLNVESSALELWDWPTGKLRYTAPFAPPEKFRTSQMSTAVTINGGKELLALFVYDEEMPSEGSGPAFRGMVQLERWDLTTGNRLEVTPYPQYAMPGLLSDGEKPLLADNYFVIKEALTGKEVFRLSDEQKKQYQSLAFGKAVLSPDGNTLAVPSDWSEVATVQFIDLKTGKDLGKRTFAEQPRSSVRYLPDGRLITIGESVLVWKK